MFPIIKYVILLHRQQWYQSSLSYGGIYPKMDRRRCFSNTSCCFAWFNQRGSSALYSIRFFKVSFFFENHFCRTKSVFRESNHSSFFRAHTSSLKRLVRGSNANFCVALQRKTSFFFLCCWPTKKMWEFPSAQQHQWKFKSTVKNVWPGFFSF